ncbi:MAG: GNAT family N-acetyltransferase [Aggregatilineales bacterium]
MTIIRPMATTDVLVVAEWLPHLPLMQRYSMSAERTSQHLSGALARGDILLTADALGVQACGLAWCMPQGMFGRSPYLRLLAVKAGMTSGGIGSALLTVLEGMLVGQHAWLFLLVTEDNVPAQRFYLRHGYQQVGAISGYLLPAVVECLFTKRLTH